MPGRVASRAPLSSTSRNSRKASKETLKAHSSTSAAHRTSSPAVDLPDEGPTTTLRAHVSALFGDAQRSTAGHRKCVVNLRKVQEDCCYEPVKPKKKHGEEEFGEEEFATEVVRCVGRVLAVKKSEPVGDRSVRFLGLFLKYAADKDIAIWNPDPDATTLPETPTSRLATLILTTLLPLLHAKDKVVRFRSTQIVSHIINTLDTLDDSLFHLLRLALLKRIRDKEPSVRVQAVYGLGRLAGEVENNDAENSDSEDDDVAGGILSKLLDVLQNDQSAEVRRALLLGLPFTPATLPYLLERARDLDGATRRALYARLLPALGDFRHLSLTHREKLLRWGLRDRDENVRKATARLFRERWIEDCAGPQTSGSENTEENAKSGPNQAAAPSFDALLELLERVDVVNSGIEGGIALEAMDSFWEGRPDYREFITFDDAFWSELSPESVFIARTFNSYCRRASNDDGRLVTMLEDKMPEVTKFAFLLERQLNFLIEAVRAAAVQEEGDDQEEESVQREFVVEQMLHMALTFDYSDEVGRRKTFSLMREALAMPELPEESTKLVVEVLRLVCGEDAKGEREFCGVVLEAVAEVHDTILGETQPENEEDVDEDESFHSAKSEVSEDGTPVKTGKPDKTRNKRGADGTEIDDEERAIREIMVNMKCLHIAQCMLQNIQCELEENVHLITMLNNLVVPAVRSQEAPIREKGLICLGLCCLLGKNLAEENLTLFLHCFARGHPALQTIALQIIADILTTHPSLLAPVPPSASGSPAKAEQEAPNLLLKPVLKAFSKALKSGEPQVQSTGGTALSKLMLSQLITDTDLLKQIVVAYYDPETSANSTLRQALSYFLPVYCHSRKENAERMSKVAVPVIHALSSMKEAFAEDEDMDGEMVSLTVIGGMLVDWTDPRKIVGADGHAGAEDGGDSHLLLAEEILERLVTSQTSKDEKKIYFSILSKLHFPSNVASASPEHLRTVLELLAETADTKVATDATSRNTLTKLQASLLKLIHDSAAAERGGGEETVLDETIVPRGTAAGSEEDEEEGDDDVTMQLRREMEQTKIEDDEMDESPDAEGTILGDETVAGTDVDVTGLADDDAVQSLLDSIDDGDDEDLL
ncbi:chromosome condensation complex Condensin, subunit G [Elasticomyces elasticus]|nr:chromosome condensation complex Condensin, subunit G [Elasticomyces elasticus]